MSAMVADRLHMTSRRRATAPAVLVALALVLGMTATSQARDLTGKGSIGVLHVLDTDLLRPPTLAFRYWRTSLAIEMLVGADWQARKWPADDLRETQGGVGVLFRVIDQPKLSVAFGVRGWFRYGWTISDPAGEEESWIGALLELPLQAEYFFSDHSSIVASFGPSLAWSDQIDNGLTNGDTTYGPSATGEGFTGSGLLMRLGGGHGGGLGYSYYF